MSYSGQEGFNKYYTWESHDLTYAISLPLVFVANMLVVQTLLQRSFRTVQSTTTFCIFLVFIDSVQFSATGGHVVDIWHKMEGLTAFTDRLGCATYLSVRVALSYISSMTMTIMVTERTVWLLWPLVHDAMFTFKVGAILIVVMSVISLVFTYPVMLYSNVVNDTRYEENNITYCSFIPRDTAFGTPTHDELLEQQETVNKFYWWVDRTFNLLVPGPVLFLNCIVILFQLHARRNRKETQLGGTNSKLSVVKMLLIRSIVTIIITAYNFIIIFYLSDERETVLITRDNDFRLVHLMKHLAYTVRLINNGLHFPCFMCVYKFRHQLYLSFKRIFRWLKAQCSTSCYRLCPCCKNQVAPGTMYSMYSNRPGKSSSTWKLCSTDTSVPHSSMMNPIPKRRISVAPSSTGVYPSTTYDPQ